MIDPDPASTFRETASALPLGAMVVFLYILFVSLVFAGFGSYIYRGVWIETIQQDRVTPDSDSAEAVEVSDLDHMIFIIKRKKSLARDLAIKREQLLTTRQGIAQNIAEYNIAIASGAQISAKAVSLSRETVKALSRMAGLDSGESLARLVAIDNSDAPNHKKITQAVTLVRSMSGPVDMDAMSADRFAATKVAFGAQAGVFEAEIVESTEKAHATKGTINASEEFFAKLGADELDIETQLADLEKDARLTDRDQARFESLFFAIPIVGTAFQRLVSFPTIFLTLIVTIAAGGLGTVVAFSRRYYHVEANGLTMSRLFVNVGEGIAAAIAIFLFSGAGMLALTQGGGAQSDVELSPYTVAFVAFLSGFMAEDAFAAIQAAGKRLFSASSQNVGNPAAASVTTQELPIPTFDATAPVVIKP